MKNSLKLLAFIFFVVLISSCQKEYSLEGGDFPDPNSIYDVDARKFIDSCAITDTTQKVAINNFVVQLKDSALWSKFIAIYPMVGGTAATTKWNLMDPRDSDVAYRLTFNGTPVFASTGLLFPTTSDYADTHLSDAILNYNDNAISYYSETQNSVSGYDIGCNDNVSPNNEIAIFNKGDASVWFGYYDFGPAPDNTKGLFMLSATVSNVVWYQNGLVENTTGATPVSGSTGFPIHIGAVTGAPSVGLRECALATIGKGLSDAQALTFYNIVKKFQTALGR